MVREARDAILKPGAQISKAGAEFMPPGARFESMSFVVNILACKLKIVNNRN